MWFARLEETPRLPSRLLPLLALQPRPRPAPLAPTCRQPATSPKHLLLSPRTVLLAPAHRTRLRPSTAPRRPPTSPRTCSALERSDQPRRVLHRCLVVRVPQRDWDHRRQEEQRQARGNPSRNDMSPFLDRSSDRQRYCGRDGGAEEGERAGRWTGRAMDV